MKLLIEDVMSSYDNRKIIDTNHSIERFLDSQRFDSLAGEEEFKEAIYWVINNAIEKIIYGHDDESAIYGVHSKSTGIGVIINWREERYNGNGKNHAIIVTLLPVKKSHTFDYKDIVLVVESQLFEWASEQLKLEGREILQEKDTYSHTKFDNIYENLIVSMWEGKYWDSNINEIIIVK